MVASGQVNSISQIQQMEEVQKLLASLEKDVIIILEHPSTNTRKYPIYEIGARNGGMPRLNEDVTITFPLRDKWMIYPSGGKTYLGSEVGIKISPYDKLLIPERKIGDEVPGYISLKWYSELHSNKK